MWKSPGTGVTRSIPKLLRAGRDGTVIMGSVAQNTRLGGRMVGGRMVGKKGSFRDQKWVLTSFLQFLAL